MKDISGHLITARKLLAKVEQLNANPDINGINEIIDTLIDLDMIVQAMLFNFDIKVERK